MKIQRKLSPLIILCLCILSGTAAFFLGVNDYTTIALVFMFMFIFLLILSLVLSGLNLFRKNYSKGDSFITFSISFLILIVILVSIIYFLYFFEFAP